VAVALGLLVPGSGGFGFADDDADGAEPAGDAGTLVPVPAGTVVASPVLLVPLELPVTVTVPFVVTATGACVVLVTGMVAADDVAGAVPGPRNTTERAIPAVTSPVASPARASGPGR
jgi:hypothetical protein